MSTRASIIIRDEHDELYFYRHSDGYPEVVGNDLTEFVRSYANGSLRDNAAQSAGWLIVRGHFEYKRHDKIKFNEPDCSGPSPDKADKFSGWKVGAYEPSTGLHGDVEYIYIIDLQTRTLSCRVPKQGFWDNSTLENTVAYKKFKTVKF